MATLELNNEKFEINEDQFFNLKSLIPQLQRKFPVNEYIIKDFEMNGRKLNYDSEDPELVRPISKSDVIKLNLEAKNKSVKSLLSDTIDLTNKILFNIEVCTDLLKENKYIEAKAKLNLVIEAIETFIVTSSYCCLSSENAEDLPYKELQIHLLSIMKAISDAYTKADTIMLTDLLEYELKDNLTQWKIHIFTSLKTNL